MGWFANQIEERKKYEEELIEESFEKIAQAIVGRRIEGFNYVATGADVEVAITQLLKYFKIKEKETPSKCKDLQSKLDYQLSSSGVMYREVVLEEGWQKDAMGVLIANKDGKFITLIPKHTGRYAYVDPASGIEVNVTKAEAKKIGLNALCFYTPLPMRAITIRDLINYMKECLSVWDIASFALATFVITLVGMVVTKATKILVGPVVEQGSYQLLIAVLSMLVCAMIGTTLFNVIKSILLNRVQVKLNVNVNAATMMRVLALPTSFFKNYSAGELNEYIRQMSTLCNLLISTVLSTGITSIFSIFYIAQIVSFAKSLVVPSIVITILSITVSFISTKMQVRISKERVSIQAKENGLSYALINGIQKIRLSGAENRAFAKWAKLYSEEAKLTFNPPLFLKLSTVVSTAITLIGTIVMYSIAFKTGVSIADYYAFNAAYGYVSAAFSAVAAITVSAGTIKPIIEIIKPLLDAEPEIKEGKETVVSIGGTVEFSHVSFKYTDNSPLIVDDLTMKIERNQYVAIVGKTGCGKSTLVRLLMGFETPTRGSILFDNKDMQGLDMTSVRRCIGTVMQDSKVFSGSIFENIIISDSTLTQKDAWEAAELAGIAEDIRKMPMGMNTVLQEGNGQISGGQRQRLMIARAVANKPKILIFDEATSALDNITQKQISDSLDNMNCTRIVIAHRLSTIKHCDRILVFDHGKIIEDGTYEELIALNGFFADLVERQRLDK